MPATESAGPLLKWLHREKALLALLHLGKYAAKVIVGLMYAAR